jgi:luciferase family oxidoreductase group 1
MPALADIRLSVLDLAPVRLNGTIAEALNNSLDLARHVEKLDYHRFWLAEHHNMPGIASSATSVVIGHIAGGTSTIRVGSGGVMLPNHAPLVIAEQFGTLEALYPGRIDLGLGRAPGTDQLTTRALRRDLIDDDNSFPRNVQELLALLAPAGEGQKVRAVPGSGSNVPVWLLGSSTFSAQLAGMLGLPFAFASHFAPQRLMEALDVYRHFFRASEYRETPYAAVGVPVVAADTDAEAHYQATSLQQRLINLVRGKPTTLLPPVKSMDGLWDPNEEAYVRSHLGIAIIGGPSAVRDGLAELAQATDADELIITSEFYDHADRKRSFEIIKEAATQQLALV